MTATFKPYNNLTDEDYLYGFQRKFMAHINLVRIGTLYANDIGSFTLSSGYLSDYPYTTSAATGPQNAAVDSFVRMVRPMLSREIHLNVVSAAPVVLPEDVRPGVVTASQTTTGYITSIEGKMNGEVIRVWGGREYEPRG